LANSQYLVLEVFVMKRKIFFGFITAVLVFSITACSGALQIEIPGLDDLQLNPLSADSASDGSTTDPAEGLPAVPQPPQPLDLDNLENLQSAYISIYEKVLPSVVFISSTKSAGFPSYGSGFIWDEQGHIVTNNHVIEDGNIIRVDFSDGRSVLADLVGADPDSDLAVLKVDLPADELVPITVSDSTKVKVGQIVVAIGNPFLQENSMSAGIISGLGRSLNVRPSDNSGLSYSIPDVIQTDAAINPGNSGGVLVDINGGLIGVPTAIESPVRASSGVGYVVPSVIVSKVVPLLIRDGQYLQPWIGISGRDLTPEFARLMELDPTQKGALVDEVLPNSPAEEAGLLGSSIEGEIDGVPVVFGGDVVISADDNPIEDMEDLVTFLAREAIVGQTISLTVIRDGETLDVDLTLKARPGSAETEEALEPEEINNGAWLGISGITMIADLAQAMELPADTEGVLIQTISVDSPADEAGLRGSFIPFDIDGQEVMIGGDVIERVNREPITSIEELVQIIANSEPGDEVALSILRDGRTIRVNVTLGEIPQ
jgi:serine protease Do